MHLSRFGYAAGLATLVLAVTHCSSDDSYPVEDRDAAPKSDGGTSKSDGDGSSVDAGDVVMPPTSVIFTVPTSGGAVDVGTRSGDRLTFSFPPSAAGKAIALSAGDPASIGFTGGELDDVIRMDPDGTTFADPVVVQSSKGILLAIFPTTTNRTAPEWLPLSGDGKGAELRHFSSLGVAHVSCPFSAQTNAPGCMPSFPSGGTALAMTCDLPQLCSNVTVTCCVDPKSGDQACRFGAAGLRVVVTAIEGPSYCPLVDGGRRDASTDASGSDAAADQGPIDSSTADASTADTSIADAEIDGGAADTTTVDAADANVADAAADAGAADAATDTSTGADADTTQDASTADATSTDTGSGDATTPDASTGVDADAASGDATDAPTADALADSGVNGTCGSASYGPGDAGPSSCLVSRSDGTATLWMVCDGSSCHCYVNDTNHPYGSPFDVGNSPCLNSQLAMQQMIAFCGCP